MNGLDLIVLSPLIIIAATSVVSLLTIAFHRSHRVAFSITLIGNILALGVLPFTTANIPRQITPLIIIDAYAVFFIGLLLCGTIAVVLLTYTYLRTRPGRHEELYVLLVTASLGSAVLAAGSHFATLFLGLELLTVSLYVLIAYVRTDENTLEAGIKYLILAALSSAFLLFGMALLYSDSGTMQLDEIASLLKREGHAQNFTFLIGLALVFVGAGFKLAVVPFHMWTPDIYQGAPAPIGAFVATVSKGGMFALLLRYFAWADFAEYSVLFVLLVFVAVASMIVGNLLALLQNNVKRLLGYSSIAHFGYLLVALLAGGQHAGTAACVYLTAYFVTMIAAFGIISVLRKEEGEMQFLDSFRGLFWTHPWLAGIFTAVMFSLAGIPLTGGFVGKFYVVTAGIGSALWFLIMVLIATSVVGLYYYLRVVVTMAMDSKAKNDLTAVPTVSLAAGITLGLLTVLLVWIGIYPAPLIRIIQIAVSSIG